MSLLNTTLQTIVVKLRDMSGNVTLQKLHNRVFDAYEAKSLVFEAITPSQQVIMHQFSGSIPAGHPAGQPILVDSWAELVQLHQPDNLYQLLPRRARNNMSYAVMTAICCSAGSPFQMQHRQDPIDYKFIFRAADFEFRNEYNAKHQDKVPPTIWFDGILQAPSASALISVSNSLTPAHVNNLAGTDQFLRAWVKQPADGDRHRQLKELYMKLLSQKTHLFLGSNTVPGRELLNYAKSKNIFVYSKKGMQYQYYP